MEYLSKRKVNSLFGAFEIKENNSIEVDLGLPANNPNYYDYVLRMSNGNNSLQKEIIDAKTRLDMKYDTANYLDSRNKEYINNVNKLQENFKESYNFYINQSYSQDQALKKAREELKLSKTILDKRFKEKYPQNTKSILNKMHMN